MEVKFRVAGRQYSVVVAVTEAVDEFILGIDVRYFLAKLCSQLCELYICLMNLTISGKKTNWAKPHKLKYGRPTGRLASIRPP